MIKHLFLIACVVLSCTSKSKKAETEIMVSSINEWDIATSSVGTPERVGGVIMQLNDQDAAPQLLALFEQEPMFKLNAPAEELQLVKNDKDELGYQHLTFHRVHNGINIWGDELKCHINEEKELYLLNGLYQPSLPKDFSTSTTLTDREAEQAAKQALSFSYVNQDETKLFIYPLDSGYRMTWHVIVGQARLSSDQWECLVDAETGDILYKSSLLRSN